MAERSDRAPEAVLARLGLDEDTAAPALRSLGVWDGDVPDERARPVVEAIADGANPDLALDGLVRLAERQPTGWRRLLDSGHVGRAACVAGASRALGDLLAGSWAALETLLGDLRPTGAATVEAACADGLAAAESPLDAAAALATVQRAGLVRVAARDLLGLADTPTAASELADLAQGVLAAALAHVRDDEHPRVAVIGMGKLGGRELNYVSDVDVLFVHDGDWARANRLAERFLRLLGTVTPEGRAYEVDANLRPEGRDGPLSRSLDAYGTYYSRWARTWEFQALLKARPVAGDAKLGAAFVELAAPFVWPDRLEAAAVEEIRRMKGVVESSREVQRVGDRQVKLGPGGLRDIEFAVQLLQLVHGRHDPSLRSPNTLEALAALAEGGYVDEGDAAQFTGAYRFLRTVEHRLQLWQLRRTHTIPDRDVDRRRLARAMGFRDDAEAGALERFDDELRQVRGLVRRLHEQLFYRPLLDRFAELSGDEVLRTEPATGEGRLAIDAARERLTALGFADPAGAMRHLEALASGVNRRARLFRTLLPALLPTLAAAPDPDRGLAAFRSLADRLGDSPFFLRTLRDTPPVGELLAHVLGSSRLVGEWLERQPEVFGLLADPEGLARRIEPAGYRRLTDGLLRRGPAPDDAADALRRLRRREAVRVAVRDLSGQADVTDVAVELTGIAEACLEAAVAVVAPEHVRLAVIGMGKLGGRELGYASDLDVLLVYEPADARDDALRAAERLLRLLSDVTPEGQAFRVDANLRPEGKDGPLARTLESYRTYYARWGAHWEFQALTQARPVAGDRELGEEFLAQVADLIYPASVPAGRLSAVRRMKARIERERAGGPRPRPGGPRIRSRSPVRGRAVTARHTGPQARRDDDRLPVRPGDRVDLKLGAGGQSDVEWTVQLLQLARGGHLPKLRVPGARAAIDACERAGVLEARDARWLREGLDLVARVRNTVYLSGARDADRLPPGGPDTERVARMLGYPAHGQQALLDDLGRAMRRVRKVHERVFYS